MGLVSHPSNQRAQEVEARVRIFLAAFQFWPVRATLPNSGRPDGGFDSLIDRLACKLRDPRPAVDWRGRASISKPTHLASLIISSNGDERAAVAERCVLWCAVPSPPTQPLTTPFHTGHHGHGR